MAVEVLGSLVIAVTGILIYVSNWTKINTFLYGLCLLQFIRYFTTSGSQDHLWTQLLVSWELLVDTCQSAVMAYSLWQHAVDNFLNEEFLETVSWPVASLGIFAASLALEITRSCAYQLRNSDPNIPLISGKKAIWILDRVYRASGPFPHRRNTRYSNEWNRIGEPKILNSRQALRRKLYERCCTEDATSANSILGLQDAAVAQSSSPGHSTHSSLSSSISLTDSENMHFSALYIGSTGSTTRD
ncbi:hypothetical protein GYMLUDRAFT_251010 [Collybiopsis luxurians FD-317 M1]|uniref:Uncharacterized protein n=1 Tax=Collybiopsis luxurians FD-317 M1 TaxID=944289 RepID=A0A0D0AQL4_9AGAR|nr:hypothetical protein GYMLUDRAFT_251010 [Collybiopsis luxurians FD-317 M1]